MCFNDSSANRLSSQGLLNLPPQQPNVGKTSLTYRLTDGTYDPQRKSTLTVETHTLPLPDGHTARIWDFGGQEFMHATHPFFFSARAVYLLVLNVRNTYEQNRVEYWLRLIRAYGGDTPVIVAANQADADQHRMDLPQNRLHREFSNIVAFVQTSAQDNTGIEDLREAIAAAVDSLPHVRVLFAHSHLAVKAALEAEKQHANIIPRSRYAEICAANGIEDPEDQEILLALMHDLGVVLDFRDENNEPLSEAGILNPNWVTEAVYRIITAEEVRVRTRGRLTEAMLRRILPSEAYTRPHRRLIMELMQRFELAYPEGAGTWWLPNAMPQDEPEGLDFPADALRFEYDYPELPESVITRFIVRTHEWIDGGRVWRWGVVLRQGENRALVRADVPNRRVEIFVDGPETTRVYLLAQIRGHLETIHKTFTRDGKEGESAFVVKAYIRPTAYPGLRVSFDDLLVLAKDGRRTKTEVWEGKAIDLDVHMLLVGYTPPEEHKEMVKELNIYGDVIGSSIVQGSGNTVNQQNQRSFNTPFNPALAPLLEELTAAVEDMLSHLDDDTAQKAQKNLRRLQEELQEKSPDKAWYSVSIEGLKAAARNVGEIGAPVIMLADKILRLLG